TQFRRVEPSIASRMRPLYTAANSRAPGRYAGFHNRLEAIMRTVIRALAFAPAFVCILAHAQSTNRDRPTPFPSSGEVSGKISESEKSEFYYSLTAGPGTVTVTADVVPHAANLNLEVGLFDK